MSIYLSNPYYVYMFLREDNTPYYVGKGKGGRAFNNHRKGVKPPEDKNRIIFFAENLTEEEAFDLEKHLIKEYGRKDLGTGILRNLTDGGEGTSGKIISEETRSVWSEQRKGRTPWNKGIEHSDDSKQKMSASAKKRRASTETREKMSVSSMGESNAFYGKTHSEDVRRKLSEINTGRKQSSETKLKKAQSLAGRKRPDHSERMKLYWKNKKNADNEQRL